MIPEITIGINLEQLVKDKLENLPENLKNQTAKWQQYQDKDGKAGVEWEIPTTSVTITVEEPPQLWRAHLDLER